MSRLKIIDGQVLAASGAELQVTLIFVVTVAPAQTT